jgi:hypothetical protein
LHQPRLGIAGIGTGEIQNVGNFEALKKLLVVSSMDGGQVQAVFNDFGASLQQSQTG